jgi:dihydrolipoamide dehydrogenase
VSDRGGGEGDLRAEVLVLGAGPGGYSAAFRAADLGRQVVLVERFPTLGGVCLNVGCIPSKAFLHVAEVMAAARALREAGVEFGEPRIDLGRLRAHRDAVVGQLTGGLAQMAKQRGVTVLTGQGRFTGPRRLSVQGEDGDAVVAFEHAVVAVGSRPLRLPGLPEDDPRVMDSTAALALEEQPRRLLVVGGGIIGLELATVYDALGCEVTVVEALDRLLPGPDPDLVRPLARRIEARYAAIHLRTRVAGVEARSDGLLVSFEGERAPAPELFDRVLVSVGRRPNGDRIGAEAAGLRLDERGFVAVDADLRTHLPHVFAIGDVARPPLLAHKASHEGRTVAEALAGLPARFDTEAVPSVAYTDPEVAWVGITEASARERGVAVEAARFPWQANGRALGMGRGEGMTKLIFEKESRRLVGAGIVGTHAGELVSECALAIEMGADAEDVALTVHPHPTLSETVGLAAEVGAGTVTDLYVPKRRRT